MALYLKIHALKTTIYVESFMAYEKVHNFLVVPLYYISSRRFYNIKDQFSVAVIHYNHIYVVIIRAE